MKKCQEELLPEVLISKSKTTPSQMLIQLIYLQKEKEDNKNIWRESPFHFLPTLQSNNVGNVGEFLIQSICQNTGIDSSVDGSKTKQKGGGTMGDGIILEKSVEIKTAHLGSDGSSLQHELGEQPWKSDYLIFIDITPSCFYITIMKNFTEEHYKSGAKCEPYFPTKSVTWRKKKGAFKLDTTIKINEKSVESGYAIKVTDDTIMEEVGNFIRSSII